MELLIFLQLVNTFLMVVATIIGLYIAARSDLEE